MNTLKDYVNFKLTHADKIAEANGYPLKMENCKKYKKMRDLKVYGNSVQDGTPTPDAPIEVQSVGELTYNLLNDTTFKNSDTITGLKCDYEGDGVFHIYGEHNPSKASGELYSSIFSLDIPIDDVDSYYSVCGEVIEGTSGNLNTYFFLSVKNETTTVNFANIWIPSNSKTGYAHQGLRKPSTKIENATSFSRAWLYFTFNSSNEPEYLDYRIRVWFFKGEEVKPYEPYGKYKIPVVVRGINLLKDAREIYNGNGAEDSGIATHYTETIEDGRECVKFQNSSYVIYRKIKFKENTQYTFSFDCKCVKQGGYTSYPPYDIPLRVYYTNGNATAITIANDGVWRRLTFTSAKNSTIAYIGGISFDYRDYMYIDINSFQIQEGATATECEPYQAVTTNIFLDEPLRKVGVYADYIDFKENKVVRNIGVGTSNSLSIWREQSGSYNCGITWGLKNCNYRANTALCTHFLYNYEGLSNGVYFNFIDGIYWYFDKTLFPTRADADSWITSRKADEIPLRFHYVFTTPTQEPLNLNLPKLTTKTTIIEVDTSLASSNIYGKYIKK